LAGNRCRRRSSPGKAWRMQWTEFNHGRRTASSDTMMPPCRPGERRRLRPATFPLAGMQRVSATSPRLLLREIPILRAGRGRSMNTVPRVNAKALAALRRHECRAISCPVYHARCKWIEGGPVRSDPSTSFSFWMMKVLRAGGPMASDAWLKPPSCINASKIVSNEPRVPSA
jgi:hypothetical protein